MSGRGGRPTAAAAAVLADRITAAAAELFLRDGYAATSVEAIAALAGVSKRTFYARFDNKGAVFLAVVGTLVQHWLGGVEQALDPARPLEESLLAIAGKMLDVTLTPAALALYALVTSEAMRFPELARGLQAGGVEAGMTRIAALLRAHDPALTQAAATRAAEYFQSLVVHAPQRRAIITGAPLTAAEREAWCQDVVCLFLRGLSGLAGR